MADGLYYEDFTEGREWRTPSRTVTEWDLMTYAGLSGDYHPLHTNEEFARTTEFGGRIAHGPLVTALSAGLINRLRLVEETGIAFLGFDNLRMLKAVKIGDTIHVVTRVLERVPSRQPGRGVVKRGVEVINQRAEVVQTSVMVYLMKTRPAS